MGQVQEFCCGARDKPEMEVDKSKIVELKSDLNLEGASTNDSVSPQDIKNTNKPNSVDKTPPLAHFQQPTQDSSALLSNINGFSPNGPTNITLRQSPSHFGTPDSDKRISAQSSSPNSNDQSTVLTPKNVLLAFTSQDVDTVQELAEDFHSDLDNNNDGYLYKNDITKLLDLKAIAQTQNKHATSQLQEVDQIFEQMKPDSQGRIQYDHFINWFIHRAEKPQKN